MRRGSGMPLEYLRFLQAYMLESDSKPGRLGRCCLEHKAVLKFNGQEVLQACCKAAYDPRWSINLAVDEVLVVDELGLGIASHDYPVVRHPGT